MNICTNVGSLLFNVGILGPAVCILGASYAECDRITAVTCFVIGMGLNGAYIAGIKTNNFDLAPNYAGVMMALSNSICSSSGFIAPYVVGIFTPNVR